jgi:hypothetical protein
MAIPFRSPPWRRPCSHSWGVVSIAANFALAWQARSSAKATRDGVQLQREELETVKRQLKLAEDQFAAAQDSARPRLRPQIRSAGGLYTDGVVAYVHGSEPAYKIRVWIRGHSRPGAAWGLYLGRIGFMIAADREMPFKAVTATAQEQTECPFPEFLDAKIEPAVNEFMVGLTWERLHGTVERQAYGQRLTLAEPPPTRMRRRSGKSEKILTADPARWTDGQARNRVWRAAVGLPRTSARPLPR